MLKVSLKISLYQLFDINLNETPVMMRFLEFEVNIFKAI